MYTCTCTVHDKLSCTRLQNYTIGASLKSVSVLVSVPWNLSLSKGGGGATGANSPGACRTKGLAVREKSCAVFLACIFVCSSSDRLL